MIEADRIRRAPDADEDENWLQLSQDRFRAAYSEEDAVYEKLDHGPALR